MLNKQYQMSDHSQKIVFTGGMNSDVEPLLLPEGDYLEQTYNFNSNDPISGKTGIGTNLPSTTKRNIVLPAGTNRTKGEYFHKQTQKNYRFNWNSNLVHQIIETDFVTGNSVYVMRNLIDTGGVDVLNFSNNEQYNILHINIKNGSLYWTEQGYNEARKINIEKAKNGGYGTILSSYISAAKAQPASPPRMIYGTDASKSINKLIRHLYQSRQQWVYDDFEISAWSSISKRPFVPSEQNPNLTSGTIINNVLYITIDTGPANVKKINIAISDNDTIGFYQIITIDKAEFGLADNTTFTYAFYNDAVGSLIAKEDSLLNFDFFPRKPVVQELLDDDIITYGNFLEGRANIVTDIRTSLQYITPPQIPGGYGENILTYKTFKENSSYLPGVLYQDDIGRQWLIQTKSTNKFDTPRLVDNHGRYGILNWEIYHMPPIDAVKWQFCLTKNLTHQNFVQYSTMDVVYSTDNDVNYRYSTEYVNLQVQNLIDQISDTNNNYSFGYDFEPGDRVNFIAQVVRPGLAPISFYDTEILGKFTDEQRVYKNGLSSVPGHNSYVTLDAAGAGNTFLTDELLGREITIAGQVRTIADILPGGNKMRLSSDIEPVTAYSGWSIKFAGVWIKIKKPTFTVPLTTLIEIYKPKVSIADSGVDDVFYEIGECFDILNPGLSNRAHAGQTNNQNGATPARGTIYGADCYIKTRSISIPRPARDTNPSNSDVKVNVAVEDFNFSDWYPSKLYDYGRFSAQEANAREVHEVAAYRFSKPFIQNTTINGLSRFYGANKVTYQEQYGEILRCNFRNRVLTSLQELRAAKILINQKLISNNEGENQIILSDQLFNDIQYCEQEYGIGRMPGSYAFYDVFEWFTDGYNDVCCEMTGLNVKDIGIASKFSKHWANKLSSLRKTNSTTFSYVDEKRKLLIISNHANGDIPAESVAYDMIKKRFTFKPTFVPDIGGSFSSFLTTYKNGEMWVHDNEVLRNTFYGSAVESSVVAFAFNDIASAIKILLAMKYHSNRLLDVPVISIPEDEHNPTGMLSRLTSNRFEYLEGDWYSTFLKDMNTPGSATSMQKLFEGRELKGKYAIISLRYSGSDKLSVSMAEVYYTPSFPTD